MKFNVWCDFSWHAKEGENAMNGYELYAPRQYDLPFYPQRGDQLIASGIYCTVQNVYWDCDSSEGELYIGRLLNCEKTCREWALRLVQAGWSLADEFEGTEDEQSPVIENTAIAPKAEATEYAPSQVAGSGLDFSKIAQIMRDSAKASRLITHAMGVDD